MSFDIDVGFMSERGPRERNEDFAAAGLPAAHEESLGLIAAIADGVSTGGGGLLAAQTSVNALVQDYFAAPPTWDTTVVLDRIVAAQNAWLSSHNRRQSQAAMCTLTAVALRGHSWTVAHVGDTRAYLLRDGELRRLTQDHSLDHLDLRSRLTRALGQDDAIRVDYQQGELHVGDTFVLLSDGVHTRLKQARIAALAAQGDDASAASAALVQAALAAGSTDNATALVLRVRGLARSRLEDEYLRARQLPALRRLQVGDEIDGLEVLAQVADNGIHTVYRVRDRRSGTLRALKALSPARGRDEHERAFLAHEAWLSQRVAERSGAGFARWVAAPEATAFYVLHEWHEGKPLDEIARAAAPAKVPVADAVAWARAACQALGLLHRLGVVHRDVKPANLHLGDDGQLRLLDLGVALSGNELQEQRALHAGTPSYMSPELWEDEPADAQSDLFALGVSLYEWLTGHLPFGDIEPYQTSRLKRSPKPPSRLRPDVPIWLDHVVLKAIAYDKKQRMETAEEFALSLERGASRPMNAPSATPLMERDPVVLLKVGLAVSAVLNLLLLYWLLFLPR